MSSIANMFEASVEPYSTTQDLLQIGARRCGVAAHPM